MSNQSKDPNWIIASDRNGLQHLVDLNDFELTPVAELTDEIGQKYGHDYAGDCINVQSVVGANKVNEIAQDENSEYRVEEGDCIEESECNVFDKIVDCIESHNISEMHLELEQIKIMAYFYNNGHNRVSVSLAYSHEENVDLCKLDSMSMKEAIEQWEAVENFPQYEAGNRVVETEEYEFEQTLFAGGFSTAIVSSK